MAKKFVSTYPFPSRFGSHSSMVLSQNEDEVLCEDEFGRYSTSKKNLDSGLADPNRTATSRISKLFQSKKDMLMCIVVGLGSYLLVEYKYGTEALAPYGAGFVVGVVLMGLCSALP